MGGRFKLIQYIRIPGQDFEVLAVFDSQTLTWTFDHGWESLPVRRIGRLSLHDCAAVALTNRFPDIEIRERPPFIP